MQSVYKILDANMNRLREALRVIEDLCRFSGRAKQQAELKELRHRLKAAAALLPGDGLLLARDVERDCGTGVQQQEEYRRDGAGAVLRANLKRAQESARSLEETGKVVSVEFAMKLEALRYALYGLEQVVLKGSTFPSPCLYVLITKKLCGLPAGDVLKMTLDGGANVVQLREKEMEDGKFLDWIEEAKAITDSYDVPLLVNDRIHLAVLSGAAGVHLGQGDLPTEKARELLSPVQWIGRSTHCLEQARQAEAEGCDYIGVGPLFPTQTKEHRDSVGLGYLREVQENTGIPYVGIGSVNRSTYPDILKNSPTGLAICTAIISHDDPHGETEYYARELRNSAAR